MIPDCSKALKSLISIDRKNWVKLPHQVADALRCALADGVWAPGEKLPSTRVLSREFGVSRRVTMGALRILEAEGRVSLRERSCAVVNVEESLLRNHQVLLLSQGSVSFVDFEDRLRIRLKDAGYTVSVASLPRVGVHGRYDVARLRCDLRRAYELVLCPPTKRHVANVIKSSCQPFVTVLSEPVKARNFVGSVPLRTVGAESAFVRHCVSRKVKSVVVVGKWRGDGGGVISMLSAAGIAAEAMVVSAKVCVRRRENVEHAAFKAFSKRISGGLSWLPDVLYFTDDYLCYGAMTAMLTHGVRVPEDVRVATLAIRGNIRAFKTTLSRIEYDMSGMGDETADAVLKYMRDGEFPRDVSVGPRWRAGGSFP